LSGGLPAAAAVAALPQPQLPTGGEERIAHPAAQAHLLIGMPALRRGDPDFFPLAVGNYSLGGGGFVSRLVKEVRDKRGLAYSVHSYFLPLQQLGPFQIGLQTQKGRAAEALQVTRTVLAGFLAHGPSETELLAAKQNLIGSFPLRLDSNRKILENVAMIAFYDLPLDYLDRYPENIERVTAADIQAAFARRLPAAHLVTVVVAGD
jgi:zinc protease